MLLASDVGRDISMFHSMANHRDVLADTVDSAHVGSALSASVLMAVLSDAFTSTSCPSSRLRLRRVKVTFSDDSAGIRYRLIWTSLGTNWAVSSHHLPLCVCEAVIRWRTWYDRIEETLLVAMRLLDIWSGAEYLAR